MSDQLTFRCLVCGIQAKVPWNAMQIHCTCGYIQLEGLIPGLGDYVAAGLRRIGITQFRYVKVKRWLGLLPLCDCLKRQKSINTLGKRIRQICLTRTAR